MSTIDRKSTSEVKYKVFGLFLDGEISQAVAEGPPSICVLTDYKWWGKGNGIKSIGGRES